MRSIVSVAALLAAGSVASAQHTVYTPGPVNSVASFGDPSNGVLTATYNGPSAIFTSLNISGRLTEVNTSTYASEARWNISNLNFPTLTDFQPTTQGNYQGTLNINASYGILQWANTGDTFRYEAYESFNDSGIDQEWTDLSISYSNPLAAPDLGNYAPGSYVLDTVGSNFDTEIALYSLSGMLLGSNDDSGGGTLSSLNATLNSPGTYILLVSGYNSTFTNGAATPGTASGNYNLRINGASVASGTLSSLSFAAFTFNIPSPGTSAMLALAGLSAARRRR